MPRMPPVHRLPGWRPQPKAANPDHAFYGTAAWKKTRAFIRKRDRGRCALCGAPDSWLVDHRIAREEGGSDDPSNLRLLCTTCHNRRHPEKGHAGR